MQPERQRGTLVVFEFSGPVQWAPGYFSAPMGSRRFRRAWWLYFSVSLVPYPLDVLASKLADGKIVWTET